MGKSRSPSTPSAPSSPRSGFTLLELLVTLMILLVLGVATIYYFSGARLNGDLTDTAAQMAAVLRQAQSSATAQKGDDTWGVYFSQISSTSSFYALINSSTYSSSTVVAQYALPSTVGFVTSTLTSGTSLTITFSPISGDASASTTLSIYSIATPSLVENISITSPGQVSYGPGTPPLDTGIWIPVPGNSTFGTGNFYVMKYDAGCSDGLGDVENTSPNATLNTYDDYNQPCDASSGLQIASLPGAWPIASISQITAKARCASIGATLLTNNQFQTIAWNAEQVGSNWSSGSVGVGTMYSGHNDAEPVVGGTDGASAPSANDSQGYYGTDGPTSGGGTGTGGTAAQNQRRTLTLSNGSVIWDFSGNVWEYTSDTIIGANEPYGTPTSGFQWNEYTGITNWGTLSAQAVGPENTSWNSAEGIGKIFSEDSSTDLTAYAFARSGDWQTENLYNVGASDGLEILWFGITPNYFYNNDVGFRCAEG